MLKRTARPLARGSNNVVCLSCCHRYLDGYPFKIRRRSHATESATSESWYDTLSLLSDKFTPKKALAQQSAKQSHAGDKSSDKKTAAKTTDAAEPASDAKPTATTVDTATSNAKRSRRARRATAKRAERTNNETELSHGYGDVPEPPSPPVPSPPPVAQTAAGTSRLEPLSAHAKPNKQQTGSVLPSTGGNAKEVAGRPLTIVEKVREAKSRAKWGGPHAENATAKGSKKQPSYDTLRKADKVSPEEIIATAINSQPYGLGASNDGDKQEPTSGSCADNTASRVRKVKVSGRHAPKVDTAVSPAGKMPTTPQKTQKPTTAARPQSPNRSWKPRRVRLQAAASPRSRMQRASQVSKESGFSKVGDAKAHFQTIEEAMNVKQERRRKAKEKVLESQVEPVDHAEPNSSTEIESIQAQDLQVHPLNIAQPPVPYLEYGLDRVLFSPGIHQLQDPSSRVYNFDPYLQTIMPVTEFDFNALKEYKTSSQDQALGALARDHGKKYIGSTSSMTGCLAHFHFLLSSFRPLNLDMLSKSFSPKGGASNKFTVINRAPSAIFLRWKNGTYAIDADKEFDTGNVLMLLGKSMELLLTLPKTDYERYRKGDPRQVPEDQRTAPESYQYTTMGDFLMRSQLDAYDPRLPGNGTFDLKTRAVVPVRMDVQDYEPMTGYELYTLQGRWGSYEREYYDMMRATMLKYMLQARMGRMNGIFVAYHNVKRIFGFQYVPMRDMDLALHGQVDPSLGDQEFRVSLELLNKLLNKATAKFPEQSLRIHFEARQESGAANPVTALHMFAEPMSEAEIDGIQNMNKAKIQEYERTVMGFEKTSDNGQVAAAESLATAEATSDQMPDESSSSSKVQKPKESSPSMPDAESKSADGSTAPAAASIESEKDLKPLFYASVIVNSKVNDAYIEDARPRDLQAHDKWTVEYLLQEYEIGRHQWASYEDMKARRRAALADDKETEDNGDAESSSGRDRTGDYYIRFLRSLAEKGCRLRHQIDELEAGKVPVVVGEPLPRIREKVENVDQYLRILYDQKGV